MAHLVKTYPDLSIESLKGKRDRELAVWYLLRFLDPEGNGKVKLTDLCQLIEDHGLVSLANLQRRLRRGEGVFWECSGPWIFYRSLAKVAAALGALPMRAPVAIPLDAFEGLGRCRSYFYASWLNQSSNPIARQTIEVQTGLAKSSQIRYEKTANVGKVKNMAVKRYEHGEQVPPGGFVSRDGKTLNVPMPNSFAPALSELPRGQVKKVRRLIRGLVEARPNGQIKRRYFRTGSDAARCKNRDRVWFLDRRRSWRGCQLWDLCGA